MKRLLLAVCLLSISITANALILPNKIKCINEMGDLFTIDRLNKKIFFPSHTGASSVHEIVDDNNNVFISEDFINKDGMNIRIAIALMEKNGFIVGVIAGYNDVTHKRIYDTKKLTCK